MTFEAFSCPDDVLFLDERAERGPVIGTSGGETHDLTFCLHEPWMHEGLGMSRRASTLCHRRPTAVDRFATVRVWSTSTRCASPRATRRPRQPWTSRSSSRVRPPGSWASRTPKASPCTAWVGIAHWRGLGLCGVELARASVTHGGVSCGVAARPHRSRVPGLGGRRGCAPGLSGVGADGRAVRVAVAEERAVGIIA